MSDKRKIWLTQINNTYGKGCFLPYSVGLLQAYALTFPEIRDAYEFKGFFYLREPIEDMIARMDSPDVFGASCYIWNNRITLALAKAVKEKWPNCLIVLGGPHVPNRSEGYFIEHPYVDILVHGEGEETFAEVLKKYTLAKWYSSDSKEAFPWMDTVGISYSTLDSTRRTIKNPDRQRMIDLDRIPSPYLTGTFDNIEWGKWDYHASNETHRGCPFMCSFCDWGSNLFSKVKKFGDERLSQEFEWFGDRKIDLLYNCDANFAMFERDIELTRYMVDVKKRKGFPNKFRAAYAKNSGERVFQVSKMLNDAGMSKGATLSFQSMDQNTLQIIKRKNIGTEVFRGLMKRYRAEGIPTYSELIIGLPGETYDTFADGIANLIDLGQHNSLSIYLCECLPNSEMNEPVYREQYGIKSVHVPVLFYHGTPSEDPFREIYEVVTETKTLLPEDWLKCMMFSWAIQCFHCQGLSQCIAVFCRAYSGMSYREFYERLLKYAKDKPHTSIGKVAAEAESLFLGIREGKEWGIVDQRFGNIVWPVEEGSFLKLIVDKEQFYGDLYGLCIYFVDDYGESYLDSVFDYQASVIKGPDLKMNSPGSDNEVLHDDRTFETYAFPVHEYLEQAYVGEKPTKELLNWNPMKYRLVDAKDYNRDLELYAKEITWFGRKGGQPIWKVEKV